MIEAKSYDDGKVEVSIGGDFYMLVEDFLKIAKAIADAMNDKQDGIGDMFLQTNANMLGYIDDYLTSVEEVGEGVTVDTRLFDMLEKLGNKGEEE